MHQPAARASIIVLVDAGQEFGHTFSRALKAAQPGTAVFVHATARQAVEYLALCGDRYPVPDLVLLNRVLPDGVDGYAVLRAMQTLQRLARLPVLLMGSDDEPGSTEAALAAGAAGYLVKPPEKASYPVLVRDVLAWWQARQGALLLDTCRTALAPESSPAGELALQSPLAMIPALAVSVPSAPQTPDSPLAQICGLLQSLHGYVAGGNGLSTIGLFADRKLVEFTRVCREEGIEEADAQDDSRDPVLVIKRGRVIRRLMTLEWADKELERKFRRGRSAIKEQRKLWRLEQKQPGSRTLPGRSAN